MSKIRILCYGDSNTWGHKAPGVRYEAREQWTNILQNLLGNNYEIEQDGVCGRTAGDVSLDEPERMGRTGFEIALHRTKPLNYVVIALGVNDIKTQYQRTADEVIADLDWYEKTALDFPESDNCGLKVDHVIYILTSNFTDDDRLNSGLKELIDTGMKGHEYIEVNDLEHVEDGLHYSESDHKKVAQRVYEKMKELENEQ